MASKLANKAVSYIVTAGLFLLTMFPIYWLIVTSLKDSSEIFTMPPTFIPKHFTFAHFITIFNDYNIGRYFFNSVFITVTSTIVVLFIASMAAYSISRFNFKGKKFYFVVILITQMLPIVTLIIPLYTFWSNIGMLDGYLSIIVTYIGFFTAVGIWLLTSYFEGIPKEIDEAAAIDGCSSFMTLVRIIFPLAKPGLMAVGITVALSVWQELFISLTFVTKEIYRTLPSGIMGFIGSPQGTNWGPLTAMGVMAFVPVFILYIFLQKYLVKGITAGATKG